MKYFSTAWILLLLILYGSCVSIQNDLPVKKHSIAADFSGIVHAGRTDTNEEYEYLDYMGVSWILQTFYWSNIEQKQDEWDFQYYDTIVDNAGNAGLKVLGVLAYDTPWIHSDQQRHDYIPPEHIPDYLNYVSKTVEHFKGRVDAWCIWNEPNTRRFWKGTTDEFVELSRQAMVVAREADSEVVLLGGAFNRGVTGLPNKMINTLFVSGAMENADAIAFHPYELNSNRSYRLNENFKRVVDQYGFGDKVWVTEVGYPTGGWYPTKVSEKNFPLRIVKTITLLAAGGVEKIFWYQIFDHAERSNNSSENYFGLYRSMNDYTSKGAEAFRLCSIYISDSEYYEFMPRHNNLPATLRIFYFKKSNGGTLILWKDGLGFARVYMELPGVNHLQHNIITGETSGLDRNINIRVSNEPVFITWQNGHDSLEEELPAIRGSR